jgi:hypothetical protein
VNNLLPRQTLLLLFLAVAGADAAQIIPIVYRDSYVQVRAGIGEAGRQPIHVGDLLSLEIRIQFDSHTVRVEQFDSEFFQRGFAGLSGIRLFAPPVVTHESLVGELVETRAAWSFQVLDCPADQETCAGDKHYELPIMSMAYQLIDASGQTLNDKTIRFRPWPDKIIVSPALPSSSAAEGNFADYFPAGAYPDMLPVKKPSNGGALAIAAGGLLLALGFGIRLSSSGPLHGLPKTRLAGSRWERLLMDLRDSALQDEQWTDALRRCASWFCLDELDANPYAWLTDDSASSAQLPKSVAAARTLFMDIVSQDMIEPQKRAEYLHKLAQIASEHLAHAAGERNLD